MAGDDLPRPQIPETSEPVAKANIGRTGYGELVGGHYEELTSLYGNDGPSVCDYPPDITPLEKAQWWNHSLKSTLPPFISASAAENARIWQEVEIEKMLDYHPPHEVHPSELPDYHYWPPIQNELNHKPKIKWDIGTNTYFHGMDKTDLPRFFKTGVPKTPLQEQDWFIPLKQDGRFDWRENIRKNGYTASLFSRSGWDKRFLLTLNRPLMPMHLLGMRQLVQHATFFRMNEHPLHMRIIRSMSAINFDRHCWFMGLYCGLVAAGSAGGSHWRILNWECEPWNYDVKFCQYNRDKGGFHGIV